MYFTPILLTDVNKGPYFIVENQYWMPSIKRYYRGEISPPYQPYYTTLTNVYEYKDCFEKIPNKIQIETASLTFFKYIPTILPKLKQRMLNQILQQITGDPTFTYSIFEPEFLHYSLEDHQLKNNLFTIKMKK